MATRDSFCSYCGAAHAPPLAYPRTCDMPETLRNLGVTSAEWRAGVDDFEHALEAVGVAPADRRDFVRAFTPYEKRVVR